MAEEMVTIDRYLYLMRDRSRVVEEGDPAATSSLCGQIPATEQQGVALTEHGVQLW